MGSPKVLTGGHGASSAVARFATGCIDSAARWWIGTLDGEGQGAHWDAVADAYSVFSEATAGDRFFQDNVPVRRRLFLDIGCGTGRLAAALAGAFDEVEAMDVSDKMIEIATTRYQRPNIRYEVRDLNSLRLVRSYDMIVSRFAIHHASDLEGLLKHLAEHTAVGGRIVVQDLVAPIPTPPPSWYILKALKGFPGHVMGHGVLKALRFLKMKTSRRWLAHAAHHNHLSEEGFRQLYARGLPGSTGSCRHDVMSLVWERRER